MISIIIPCFNTPKEWLADCLKSIAAQTFTDWEALIVDDASLVPVLPSDLPGAGGDPRFRIVRHDRNRGPAAARNTAVAHSRGELLFTMDSDDLLEPNTLGVLSAKLLSNANLDCVYPQFRTFGGATLLWDMPILSARDMISDQWVPGPGVLMKREFYDKIGGYCEEEIFRYGNEDWDFWLGAASAGFVVERIPQDLYHYRISGGSLSNSTTKRRHYRTIERMYERHKAFIDGQGMADRFLYDGYYFSVRRCPSAELAAVMRSGFSHAKSTRDRLRLCLIFLKRVAAGTIGNVRRAISGFAGRGEKEK